MRAARSPLARRGMPQGRPVRGVGSAGPPAGQPSCPQPAGPTRAGPPGADLCHRLPGQRAGADRDGQHAPLRRRAAGLGCRLGPGVRPGRLRPGRQPGLRPLRPLHRRPCPSRLWRRRHRTGRPGVGPAPLRPLRPPGLLSYPPGVAGRGHQVVGGRCSGQPQPPDGPRPGPAPSQCCRRSWPAAPEAATTLRLCPGPTSTGSCCGCARPPLFRAACPTAPGGRPAS